MIELAYAGTLGSGHFSRSDLSDAMVFDIRKFWDLFVANKSDWHRKLLFFQAAGKADSLKEEDRHQSQCRS